ncbi:hypothetical protein JCM8097_003811 [Rhodosporidiobolus ruineniae]
MPTTIQSAEKEHKATPEGDHLEAIPTMDRNGGSPIVSAKDDKRIRCRTDHRILVILCVIYALQVLDKNIIGYTAVLGLKQDAHLVGNEYATVTSMAPYAQIVAQPLGSYLLVRFPLRFLVPLLMLLWATALMCMAAATNYQALLATRFLLGYFEASCLPAFTLITIAWYRRVEQPFRIAIWYSTNGAGTIVGALLVWGLSHVQHSSLYLYQTVFLVAGALTIIFIPYVWYTLNEPPTTAKFLTDSDRAKAIERLKANKTVSVTNKFDWCQVIDAVTDPKTYLFAALSVLSNIMPYVNNTFGPILLSSIAGFKPQTTVLLNIPFGVMQTFAILLTSWLTFRFQSKSLIFALLYMPCVMGYALLYALPHTRNNLGPLLFGFYSLAFSFGANPILVAWIGANVAGTTKKSVMVSLYQATSAAGNIIAPNLFKASDAPRYLHGLRNVLIILCVTLVLIGLTVITLVYQTKQQVRKRIKAGKPAKLDDLSMRRKYDDQASGEHVGEGTAIDQTDRENDEFIYVY